MPLNVPYSGTRVEGLDRVLKNLANQLRGIHKRSVPAMRKATLHVQLKAQANCPVDTGNLHGSADSFAIDQGWPAGALGTISFGDDKVDYAIYVHEINKNYKVGTWKFLEIALKEEAPEVLAILRAGTKIGPTGRRYVPYVG